MIDGELVKSCMQKIRDTGGVSHYVDTFYQLLYDNHPEVRSLFSDDDTSLKQHVADLLETVTAESCHLDIMHNDFMALGQRHQAYGATKPMYPAVCDIAVEALKQATENAVTDEENSEWLKVHEIMSGVMMSAYN